MNENNITFKDLILKYLIEEIEKENSELKLKKEGIESDLKLKRDNFIELDKNISSLNKENESNLKETFSMYEFNGSKFTKVI